MGATDDVARVEAALGHPTRQALVASLAREHPELNATTFARLRGVGRTPALYRHFACLTRDGVIEL